VINLNCLVYKKLLMLLNVVVKKLLKFLIILISKTMAKLISMNLLVQLLLCTKMMKKLFNSYMNYLVMETNWIKIISKHYMELSFAI